MRTNGFIFIALSISVVTLAGSHDYLPSVGPVGLHFAPAAKSVPAVTLPALPDPPAPTEDSHRPAATADTHPPDGTPEPAATAPSQNPQIILLQPQTGSFTNAGGPLIGPMVETNNTATPQMFLRFFTPNQNGPSREAIIVAPPGFSPALPPPASSTATYTQPKP